MPLIDSEANSSAEIQIPFETGGNVRGGGHGVGIAVGVGEGGIRVTKNRVGVGVGGIRVTINGDRVDVDIFVGRIGADVSVDGFAVTLHPPMSSMTTKMPVISRAFPFFANSLRFPAAIPGDNIMKRKVPSNAGCNAVLTMITLL